MKSTNGVSSTQRHYAGLIDARLIEDVYFLRRSIGMPTLKRSDPVINPGRGLGCVLRDREGNWRMYYDNAKPQVVGVEYDFYQMLATSSDGIAWHKPSLGLVDINGSKDNNCIMAGSCFDAAGRNLAGTPGSVAGSYGPHGFSVLDAESEVLPNVRGRFTAMYFAGPNDRESGICLAYSDDGMNWTAYPENPVIVGLSDTLNNFYFDQRNGKYVCFMRPTIHSGPRKAYNNRKVARAESIDLVHWTVPRIVLDTDDADADAFARFLEILPDGKHLSSGRVVTDLEEKDLPPPRGRIKQYQGMVAFPYNNLYLGMAGFYEAIPGVITIELVHSYDGNEWRREPVRSVFIGEGRPEGWRSKQLCRLAGNPPLVNNDYYIYCSAESVQHQDLEDPSGSSNLGIFLLTLGRDRWVSYDAGEREGELLTVPFNWEVGKLNLNTSIEKGGSVAVEVLDELGNRLTAWGLDEIMPLEGPLDEIDAPVRFRPLEPRTVFKFPTRGPVRLLFKMRRAKLYGWSFGE